MMYGNLPISNFIYIQSFYGPLIGLAKKMYDSKCFLYYVHSQRAPAYETSLS